MNKARIVFAGSPDFAVPVLEALVASRHEVVAVLTQPDRPAGRGRKLTPGPVKVCAEQHGLRVLQPDNLRDSLPIAQLRALAIDLLVVVAYGQILCSTVLAIPRVACVNVHASLLPRWRGAAPIQMAVLAGDAETGVCLMQMERGLDTGPVYSRMSTSIGVAETGGELHDRLARMGADLVTRDLDALLDGSLQPEPQSEDGANYAGKIKKSDGLIDWQRSAVEIARQVRAFNPWPVAQTTLNGQQLRCWMAKPLEASPDRAQPGTVLGLHDGSLQVQTGAGVLALQSVQLAGRKQISAAQFAASQELAGLVLGS